eukprot:c18932_g1_i1.p1 GENE.c18932_g1_i1~~c18932_g1_i1.p1  ORF type:complete len:219 (+),score=39.83 c18932_g1_i1:354-1010(+)
MSCRGRRYVAECGESMGLGTTDVLDLDETGRELFQTLYDADARYSSKGPATPIKPTPFVVGRIVIELFEDSPRAFENFKCLITGEKGVGKDSGKPLAYQGSGFHRIVSGFMCQGGDFVRGDGSGGESIFGKKFKDEKEGLRRKHDSAGVVGMANKGPNSNSSQFYITFGPTPQLDGKHVVVGRVVEGLDVLHTIEQRAGTPDGLKPRETVVIHQCGLV